MEEKSHSIMDEYDGAALGDQRLERRLGTIVSAIARNPSASFPSACATEAELEGFYRFIRNERVSFEELLVPHIEATYGRASTHGTVLVLHDTTDFSFKGEVREGLGTLQQSAKGFKGHFALAITEGDSRIPLGVMGLHVWTRTENSPTARKLRGELSPRLVNRMTTDQSRWFELVEDVEGDGDSRLVHVMDSGADDYTLMANLVGRSSRFVIRMHHDRALVDEEERLSEHMSCSRAVFTRSVKLSRRRKHAGYTHKKRTAPRKERCTKLSFAANAVTLKQPNHAEPSLPKQLTINVVRVWEPKPPKDAEPVEWMLATTEPIDTKASIERIVDMYRSRWTIEEFFKALKTGCAYQKRQLGSWDTLINALALLVPVAWNLMHMRTLSREDPGEPAQRVLTQTQLRVLSLAAKPPPPPNPTVADVLRCIARLGGHLRSNGPPGWLVLGRGYTKLLELEVGFRLASEANEK